LIEPDNTLAISSRLALSDVCSAGLSNYLRCQFEQWNTFRYEAAGDAEEFPAVGLGEATIAFGDVCRDRKGGLLINQSVAVERPARLGNCKLQLSRLACRGR
jgi:hypothetical protein